MGGCILKATNQASVKAANQSRESMFTALNISESTIGKLRKVFDKIDVDRSGEVDFTEFRRYFEFEKSKFAKRAFAVMDEDNSGEIDFGEFVLCVWNFCTFDKSALMRFAFELYDQDGSGAIDASELKQMLKELYGKRWERNNKAQNVYKKIKLMFDNGSGACEISFSDFRTFCLKFPAMLFPAFNMQLSFQNSILGKSFWAKESKKRRDLEAHVAKKQGGMSLPSFQEILQTMTADDAIESLSKVETAMALNDATAPVSSPISLANDSGKKNRHSNIWRCRTCGRQNKEKKMVCVTCSTRRFSKN